MSKQLESIENGMKEFSIALTSDIFGYLDGFFQLNR